MKRQAMISVAMATMWIGASEFVRNQLLFFSFWEDHFRSRGLVFPAKPINGALWMLWSLLFALILWHIAAKFSLRQTILLGWLLGFVLMWIVIGNLGVLPWRLLPFAVPLSLIEVFGAVWIIRRSQRHENR